MKSSSELQVEIESLENKLAPLNSELDGLAQQFAATLPAQVKAWMEQEVRRHIESNSDKVMSQGADFARTVKSDLQELYSQLENICLDAIGPRETWPHNKALADASRSISRSGEAFFPGAFRRAINPLGNILHKHGFLENKRGGSDSWEQVRGKDFQYAYNPGFDVRANAAAMSYNEKLLVQDRLVTNLHAKRKELDHAKARELWDEA